MPTKPPTHTLQGAREKHVYRSAGQIKAHKLRSTARWQKVREIALSRNPLCVHPDCTRPTPAREVHHILPVETHPHLAFTLDNMAPLCKSHHAKVTVMESKGIDTVRLFR